MPLTLLLTIGTIFLLLGCLCPALLVMRVYAPSYFISLYCVQLMSLGALLFSDGKQKNSGSGEEGRGDSSDQDVLYDRRINLNKNTSGSPESILPTIRDHINN